MLEIIAIILLSKKNGALAETKGLKSGTWILYTVLSWIGFEVAGAIMGVLLFGPENLVPVYLLAIASAVLGYFFILKILQDKPDAQDDDDINRIGVNDLYPHKNKS
ncbi:hypothetical protein [Ferruginibacter sp. SUN106]|uniref:hypothetical protein n=1 Tax=Ferruginibacter sp. SUN106 TaxID=2978348 RepID=UPI003D3625ED